MATFSPILLLMMTILYSRLVAPRRLSYTLLVAVLLVYSAHFYEFFMGSDAPGARVINAGAVCAGVTISLALFVLNALGIDALKKAAGTAKPSLEEEP